MLVEAHLSHVLCTKPQSIAHGDPIEQQEEEEMNQGYSLSFGI